MKRQASWTYIICELQRRSSQAAAKHDGPTVAVVGVGGMQRQAQDGSTTTARAPLYPCWNQQRSIKMCLHASERRQRAVARTVAAPAWFLLVCRQFAAVVSERSSLVVVVASSSHDD